MDGRPTVRRHLAHWLVHVTASAAASFLFAYRGGWSRPSAVAGMLAGVGFFVALYTGVWSSRWFHQRVPPTGAGRRALLYGTRVRSVLGLFGLVSVLCGDRTDAFSRALTPFFVPDLWAGMRACEFVTAVTGVQATQLLWFHVGNADASSRAGGVFFGDIDSLVPTFLITVAEGVLLTVLLLAISGVCRVVIGLWVRVHPTLRSAGAEL